MGLKVWGSVVTDPWGLCVPTALEAAPTWGTPLASISELHSGRWWWYKFKEAWDALNPTYHLFWEGLPFTNIFLSITPDVLHQLHQGIAKHLVCWLAQLRSEEINTQCARLPPNHNTWHFRKGITGLSRLTGREHKHICCIILGLIVDFKLPDTQLSSEWLHVDLTKMAFHKRNFKDKTKQMATHNEHSEAIHDLSALMQLCEGILSPIHPPVHYPPSMMYPLLALHPSEKAVSFGDLTNQYGTIDFQDALADFIVQHNYPNLLANAAHRHADNTLIPFQKVAVFHKIKFTDCNDTHKNIVDIIHVQPEACNQCGTINAGRFDTCLVKVGSRLHIVQICVVFQLSTTSGTSVFLPLHPDPPASLAYVEWFSPSSAPNPAHRMSCISRQYNICWSVQLFPVFGPVAPWNWEALTVLEECQNFYINPFLNKHIKLAKEWSEDRLLKDIQAKMAGADTGIRWFGTSRPNCSKPVISYADKSGNVHACIEPHIRDAWNKDIYNGQAFSKLCPNWREAWLWKEWMKYVSACFETKLTPSLFRHSKTNKNPITITADSNGKSDVPSVTLANGYQTKTIQTALQHYCMAHIKYTSGKKNATISWSKLANDLDDWIVEECYPENFAWADLSKLRVAQVFQLLDHWRQHEDNGLSPLIWNSSCEVLDGGELCTEYIHTHEERKGKTTSSKEASPMRAHTSSSETESGKTSLEDRSCEEDFAEELWKISNNYLESDSDAHHSVPSLCRTQQWIRQGLADFDMPTKGISSVEECSQHSCSIAGHIHRVTSDALPLPGDLLQM
ncbi:hypothetical protein EI94DRAFT_1888976 [Lactarius quietus]|nr:hypothetical protein EI94DRAFT_1888976 [Lactarius quietus]